MLGWAGQGMGAKQVVLRHGLGLNWVTAKRTQQSVCGGGGGCSSSRSTARSHF